MRGSFKREETYVDLWLIHVDVWQKPTQYYKAIILQLKINKLGKKKEEKILLQGRETEFNSPEMKMEEFLSTGVN